jgi:type IV pilus assembly protein PilF
VAYSAGLDRDEDIDMIAARQTLTVFVCLALAGCSTSSGARSPAGSITQTGSSHATPELAPDLAAKACLLTAQELEKKDHLQEAIAECERARQLAPKQSNIAWRLAVLNDRAGNARKAAAEFQAALKQQPDSADLLNDLGYFYCRQENWAEAEKHLLAAVRVGPKHSQAWINLGLVYGKTARWQECWQAFAKTLTQTEASYNVGVLLAANGDYSAARKVLERAAAEDPNLPNLQAVLARLEPKRD